MVTGTKVYEVTKQKKEEGKKKGSFLYEIRSPLELLLTPITDGEEYKRHGYSVPS